MSSPDLLVIGGGLIGSIIAWRAAQRGLKVQVLERGEVGGEATRAAGGMLAPLAEADQDNPFLRLCRHSVSLYAGLAAELREVSGIDIEYRTEGTLYLSLTEEDDEELESRHQWQRAAGLATERWSAAEVRREEPGLNPALRWALRFPDDHQVNNRRLSGALQAAAVAAGVRFQSQTTVHRLIIDEKGGRRIAGVVTDRGEIHAARVLLAAGCWSGQLATSYRIDPVRGQMIAVQTPPVGLRQVIYSRRGYLVPRLDGTVIAGSTTELVGYDRRLTPAGIASIVDHGAEIMPDFAQQPVAELWAGLRPRSADMLPILGADGQVDGLFHATGHYRNGILLAPITGQTMADLLTGEPPVHDLAPFSPTRFSTTSLA